MFCSFNSKLLYTSWLTARFKDLWVPCNFISFNFLSVSQNAYNARNSLVVQWLGFCASTAEGTSLIPGQGTPATCVSWPKKKKRMLRTSLVVQWLRICLPMQGTRVRALVREDLTCHRATKPMHYNYWACALEPTSHNYWALELQLLKPVHLEPTCRNKRRHHSEKPVHRNEDPVQPKINKEVLPPLKTKWLRGI